MVHLEIRDVNSWFKNKSLLSFPRARVHLNVRMLFKQSIGWDLTMSISTIFWKMESMASKIMTNSKIFI